MPGSGFLDHTVPTADAVAAGKAASARLQLLWADRGVVDEQVWGVEETASAANRRHANRVYVPAWGSAFRQTCG